MVTRIGDQPSVTRIRLSARSTHAPSTSPDRHIWRHTSAHPTHIVQCKHDDSLEPHSRGAQKMNHFRRRDDRSRYISDPGFSSNRRIVKPEPEEEVEEVTDNQQHKSPPPTFSTIADFERRYGTCVPLSVPTSPSRRRFLCRQSDPLSVSSVPSRGANRLTPAPRSPSLPVNTMPGLTRDGSINQRKGNAILFNICFNVYKK